MELNEYEKLVDKVESWKKKIIFRDSEHARVLEFFVILDTENTGDSVNIVGVYVQIIDSKETPTHNIMIKDATLCMGFQKHDKHVVDYTKGWRLVDKDYIKIRTKEALSDFDKMIDIFTKDAES